MDFLREAIQAQLAGHPFAWDMIEDVIVNEKSLHKMKFIWDYVWTKSPCEEHIYYFWFHNDQSYYYNKRIKAEVIEALIDMPVPAVFSHQPSDFPIGWDNWGFWNTGTHFVSTISNKFKSKEDAYYGLIWNWYNWDY